MMHYIRIFQSCIFHRVVYFIIKKYIRNIYFMINKDNRDLNFFIDKTLNKYISLSIMTLEMYI